MANPIKELNNLLHKADDYIMELEKLVGPEELEIVKEVNDHLDEAFKALKKIKTAKSANIIWADYQKTVNGG